MTSFRRRSTVFARRHRRWNETACRRRCPSPIRSPPTDQRLWSPLSTSLWADHRKKSTDRENANPSVKRRTLLIVLAVGPMALAGAWFTAGRVLEPKISHYGGGPTQVETADLQRAPP